MSLRIPPLFKLDINAGIENTDLSEMSECLSIRMKFEKINETATRFWRVSVSYITLR